MMGERVWEEEGVYPVGVANEMSEESPHPQSPTPTQHQYSPSTHPFGPSLLFPTAVSILALITRSLHSLVHSGWWSVNFGLWVIVGWYFPRSLYPPFASLIPPSLARSFTPFIRYHKSSLNNRSTPEGVTRLLLENPWND